MNELLTHTHAHDHAHDHSHAGESFDVMFQHVMGHSFSEVLYLIPFLFVTYLLMEWLEHKTGSRTQEAIRRAGAAGPVIGGLLGVVPQCGFSAASAALYAGRVVTLGTLFAVFLSTSDEMLPIFIAEQVPMETIAKILGFKIVIGMLMGFIVDAVLRLMRRDRQNLRIHELCAQDKCACNEDCSTCEAHPELVYQHHDDQAHHGHCETSVCGHSHDDHDHAHHDHSHDHGWKGIAKSALLHTVKVTLFIFAITLALNLALELIGQDTLAHFLEANSVLSIFASALLGLIPNCAASVLIAQLYLEGILGAGAMMAGLLVSAGVGLMVLVRANRPVSQTIIIIGALYATGVFWGLIINALGIIF